RPALGAERDRGGDARERVAVVLALGVLGREGGAAGGVADGGEGVLLVLFRGTLVLLEGELPARAERAAVAVAGDDVVGRLLLFHVDLGEGFAVGLFLVVAGVVVDLIFVVGRDFDRRRRVRHQAGAGRLEVVVGLGVLAGAELVLVVPA